MTADNQTRFVPAGTKYSFESWNFELRGDELADVHFQGQLILRSLRCVLRDEDWNTAPLILGRMDVSHDRLLLGISSNSYGLRFSGSIVFEAKGNAATYSISLLAHSEARVNRLGIVILHSPDLAGSQAQITRADGAVEASEFPVLISPSQPMMGITKLDWESGDAQIQLALIGDIFEMEDQRNWTDASYKTYSRPLALPFPYLVGVGQAISQSLEIRVKINSPTIQAHQAEVLELTQLITAPDIQLGASTAPGKFSGSNTPEFPVLVELDLNSSNWEAALERAAADELPMDVRLVADAHFGSEVLKSALELIAKWKPLRIAVFDKKEHFSNQITHELIMELLRSTGFDFKVIAGARSHFTELNRNQDFCRDGISGICFSSTPLFHSLDAAQLVESVAIQRLTALNALRIADGLPVHVGPVTLRPRFNNVSTHTPVGPTAKDLSLGYGAEFSQATDQRQFSSGLAAWTLASYAAFAVEGVASISWFEQWGPRGVMDSEGLEYPVLEILRILEGLSGSQILTSSNPNKLIWAVAVKTPLGWDLLASNIGAEPVEFGVSIESTTENLRLPALSWRRFELNLRDQP